MGCRFRSVEAVGSGSVFATRTSRFNKTQGAFGPPWSTSTCSMFSFISLVAIYPKACSDAGRSVAGRSHSVR